MLRRWAAFLLLGATGACSLLVDSSGLSDGQLFKSDGSAAIDATSSSDAGSPDASSTYARMILADGPLAYWRMGALVSGGIVDETGNGNDLSPDGSGFDLQAPGAIAGDPDTAAGFGGSGRMVA